MKKQLTLGLFLLLGFTTFSQIKFEKGYFIGNDGKKIDCLIKNYDWENNPIKVIYKLNENDLPKEVTINEIEGFGIDDVSKYERHTVYIDTSSQNLISLDKNVSPTFEEMQLLLKVLIEGNTNLYEFKSNAIIKKFFYSVGSSVVKQLIFREYLKDDKKIYQNKAYITQLYTYVNCKKKDINTLKKIDYDKKDLKEYFAEQNLCYDPSYLREVNNKDNGNKRKSRFKFTSGININTYKIYQTDFDTKISPRIGFEYEMILPFNKNKWGVFMEPNFRFYKAKGNPNISGFPNPMEVKYNSIELPIGLRYYMFLNEKSKVFINIGFAFDIALNSYEWKRNVENSRNYFFGVGFNFNDKVSLEARGYSNKEDFTSWGTLSQESLILTYTF